jgi:3-hydroxyacyl-CoA dehydrogenase/enoyl-CoA hydratase/3-hydroxybutyryl-CoA epimerase
MTGFDNTIRWDQGADGVVTLTLDDPNQSANTMNADYLASMTAVLDRLEDAVESIKGVILTSAKTSFFAGCDPNDLSRATKEDVPELTEFLRQNRSSLRRLETLGRPVVGAINGAALGGGLAIALATHHRIVVDHRNAVLGFPEVHLGLLPGSGGLTRTVRLVGIDKALVNWLTGGQRHAPAEAHAHGLIDEIVPAHADLIPAAKKWIARNPGAQQPWDADDRYKIPGGTPAEFAFALNLPAYPARLRNQLKGANYPAPKLILGAAIDGVQLDIDSALEIEDRYLLELLTGPVARNMIQAYLIDHNRVNRNRGRPGEGDRHKARHVVVLGAGMTGAAIAYVSASAGIDVVLAGGSEDTAQRGKGYAERLVQRGIETRKLTPEHGENLLARIRPTADLTDAVRADLVIAAVLEDPLLRSHFSGDTEPHLTDRDLLAPSTSTLPFGDLTQSVSRPGECVGVRVSSPADDLRVVEIIRGERTSDETLHRALDFVRQIEKTPIVVNDGRGFFTSRLIGTVISEGIGFLAEGIPPSTVEQAGLQAGYPTAVLALSDELDLRLSREVREATIRAVKAAGGNWEVIANHPANTVVDRMIDLGRSGRLSAAGFYEYESGRRTTLWQGLAREFSPVADPAQIAFMDLIERLLFIEAIEAVKAFDEGVIDSVADANIGSILATGFPGWTGGVLQYINTYTFPSPPRNNGPSDEAGPRAFVARALDLASRYGTRFEPPASLLERSVRGEIYSDQPRLTTA